MLQIPNYVDQNYIAEGCFFCHAELNLLVSCSWGATITSQNLWFFVVYRYWAFRNVIFLLLYTANCFHMQNKCQSYLSEGRQFRQS
jgi:hypothetical protein